MKKSIRARAFAPALSVLSLAVVASVQAQAIEVSPVVVSASRFSQPSSDSSVVVDVISRQQIEQSGASNMTEFLDSVGGMAVNRLYGRTGVDASVDIGYMGESGSQNVLILIDGQRVNTIDQSGSQFAQLPMSAVQQIEIRKANGGVLYGDRAQGGVINIITRTDSEKSVDLSVGSFGYQKQGAYLGIKTDEVRGSFSLMNTKADGYRAHSASDQRSAQLRLDTSLDIGLVSFFVRGFEEDAKLPSYLTKAQFDVNPRQVGAFPASVERTGVSTGLKYEQSLQGADVVSIDTFYQESTSKSYDTIKNSRASITPEYKTRILGNQTVIGGEFVDAQANTDQGKQAQQQTQAVFAQLTHPITKLTNLDLGLRTQRAESNFQTASSSPITSAVVQKTGASLGVLTQLTDKSTLRAGALTGFRFPNADELYTFNRNNFAPLEINPTIKPMSTQEFFLQYEQRHHFGKFAAHYRHIDAKDEIAYQYDCGVVGGVLASCNTNLYDTKRSILSFSTDWKISAVAMLKGSADFVDASISTGLNAGNRIPLTPKQVFRVAYEHKIRNYVATASAHYRTGMIQASDQTAFYPHIPSRTVVDLGVRTQFSNAISGSIWLRNAFDKAYYDYANSNGIYPADGRGIFANLKVGF